MRGPLVSPRWAACSYVGRQAALLVGALVATALVGGGPAAAQALSPPEPPATITIGSKNDTENRLLGEIMAQLIEAHAGLGVQRRVNLGGTLVVFSALRSGEIDLYAEYTGTGWAIQLKIAETVNDPLRAYLHVADEFQRRYQVTWLRPFGFSNSYALAMDENLADSLGIRTISDLKSHQEQLRAGVSHEFLNRADGYPGLTAAYGLDIADVRGMEHGLAYTAIASRRIDLTDAYTTDGKLLRYDIRLLADDRKFFPPYDAAPIIRTATLERYPQLRDVLNRLAFRIDDEQMRQLNYRVEEQGGSFAAVAGDFLEAAGLVRTEPELRPERPRRGVGFVRFMWSRRLETLDLVGQHLWLAGTGVLLAIGFAVPLGILLTRKPRLAPPVMGATGVLQTVPSLALLAFMIPLPGLGLGARSAIVALFLYALLPIVRNTYIGIKEIDADLVEAARGMGLTERQILVKVELPLATRTIMAGVRTAAVISIGVATLAAFIGAGGLGDPIVTGLQLNDTDTILSGAVPAALLALVVDFVLGRLERWLAPRGVS